MKQIVFFKYFVKRSVCRIQNLSRRTNIEVRVSYVYWCYFTFKNIGFRSSCAEHNVVPFSVALKRISEIVVHKTRQCVANLDKASKNVNLEIDQLDKNVDRIVEELNNLFQVISFNF